MSLISVPFTFTVGAVIIASQHNSNFSTIYSDYNGNITNANLSASAGIVDTKLAQITTASKVSGAAITLLTSLPSGAGKIPVLNLGSGTASSSTFLRGDQTYGSPTQSSFGALDTSKIKNTVYLASTDLWVIVVPEGSNTAASILSNAANPPTVVLASYNTTGPTGPIGISINAPIKNGEYYEVSTASNPTIYVRPIG